jgi:hypothetical protein
MICITFPLFLPHSILSFTFISLFSPPFNPFLIYCSSSIHSLFIIATLFLPVAVHCFLSISLFHSSSYFLPYSFFILFTSSFISPSPFLLLFLSFLTTPSCPTLLSVGMGHCQHCRWNNARHCTQLLSVLYEAIRRDAT